MSAVSAPALAAQVPQRRPRVLVADDEASMRELLTIVLRREGCEVVLAEDGRQGLAVLASQPIDLVVSDLKMPGTSGVEVLRAAKRRDPTIEGLMITAYASYETAVEAMRLGACDYLTKPFDVNELRAKVRKALDRRLSRMVAPPACEETGNDVLTPLIGRSQAMLDVFKLIGTIAPTPSTVLIAGESGTGKELAARTIHLNSPRRERPFVALNCGAFTETLLESELFGHVRGAFTGADSTKKGLLEVADKGTVFLDEVGEMSPAMQVKLLRVLQERRFRRVGGTDELEADIRVIAATNRDLGRAVADGRFREDLYYRLNVISVRLLPLRERREDIPLLAQHFVGKYARQMGKPVRGCRRQRWRVSNATSGPATSASSRTPSSGPPRSSRPGPSRRRACPSTCVAAGSRVRGDGPRRARAEDSAETPRGRDQPRGHVASIERELIAQALDRADGVKTRAAELLGMSFRSFRYYAKKYQLG